MGCAGHVAEMSNAQVMLVGKPEGKKRRPPNLLVTWEGVYCILLWLRIQTGVGREWTVYLSGSGYRPVVGWCEPYTYLIQDTICCWECVDCIPIWLRIQTGCRLL
jgi:hypothetical protein